ncbi:hypothetical protein C9F11_40790 [Streptomyces sp. YIM 121038]|uniref:hypothetical protein n=1 Tax=unclassified Streptomyces TaxID=2593676 RepID=UPI0004C76E59|nr:MULTISPECIES: hypothetical protein [unclassified Streptomyces]QCX81738.1 hypothetical protein C9F11_40790 [Streptomyces sp. YIM 121038]
MKLSIRRLATVGTALAATVVLMAPTASAVKPGETFRYGSLDCTASADMNGNGALKCTGTMDVTWRAKVKCKAGFTSYGSWQTNAQGGTKESKSESKCVFAVEDVTIDPIV